MSKLEEEEETGCCPHCGGESDGSCYYSCYYSSPLQTSCKDCKRLWSYGSGIVVLDEKVAKRKRPGMYYRFCETSSAMGAWHLHEPTPFGEDHKPKYGGGLNTKTLCGLNAAWDIRTGVTLNNIMDESNGPGRTCRSCREKFLE